MIGKKMRRGQKETMEQALTEAGVAMGIQKMWGYVQTALHDPEVMGESAFDEIQLEKLYARCAELAGREQYPLQKRRKGRSK